MKDITIKLLNESGKAVEEEVVRPISGIFYYSQPIRQLVEKAETDDSLKGNYSIVMEVKG